MQITKDKVVTFEFTVADENGSVLDSSDGTGSFPYIQGIGYLVPGLEEVMEDKSTGDNFKVTIAPEKAYGQKDPALRIAVPREQFQRIEDLEVGIHIQVGGPDGTQLMKVVKITDERVTMDGNHPLAGMTLNFDISIIDVRDATPEELQHGHPATCDCADDCGCMDATPQTGGG